MPRSENPVRLFARPFLCSALLGFAAHVSAQYQTTQSERCGFDHHHQTMLGNAAYAQRVAQFEEMVQHFDMDSRDAGTLFVPVVVHVLETGTSITAITDDQIRTGIRWLNERWRKVAGTPGAGNGVDTHIEFALAVRDPSGSCTTGITRHDMTGNATYMASGVFDASAGITDAQAKAIGVWDQTKYYNIWLISEFDNNNGGSGTQGYAYFSSSHGQPEDGTIMLVNAYKDATSITLAHELGHAFNVYHTFEGDVNGTTCPPNATCGTQGDLVCDTPPHIRSNSDCNLAGTNSCDGGSSNALFKSNYMDYSGDACQNMFTAGQNTRIQAAITVDRASFLATNGNMSLVPPGAPTMDFFATKSVLCGTGQSVQLYDWSRCIPNTYLTDPDLPGITFAWTISNGTETQNSSNQNPVFTLATTGIFNATLQITTSLGTYSRTENGIVLVVASPVAGCTPTTSNAGNFGQTVSNVVFNTISNGTDAITNTAYTDFACTKNTVLAAGGTYNLAITINAGGSAAESLNGYIDYNNNGVFEDPSERVITGSTATNTSTTLNANVTLPGGAVTNTLLRMRIYGEAGTLSATERTCGAATFIGDVEDYGVYITNSLASVTIAAAPGSTITYGTNVTFTPTPVNGGAGPTYTWFRNGTNVGTSATYASNNLLPGETIQCSMASNLAGVIGSPALSNTITMTVTGAPLSDFSGSPVRICAGGSVAFSDLSLLSPTSWSWTFTGGTPSSSTSQNPTVTYASAGTYNVTLVASNANGTGTTMTKTGYITVYAAPTAGCTITRSQATTSGIGITNVSLNTINNSTAYDGAVMNDYTCSNITQLSANTLYNISVTVGAFNNQWVRAYIDYNGNGVFTDSGEQIFAPANGMNARTGSFTTPAAPTTGVLRRMRVISDFVNTTPAPCTTPIQYGQVEEYGVVFLAAANTAPVLNAAATPVLAAVNEDAGAPAGAVGTLVSSLVDLATPAGQLDNVTDTDAGAVTGIAITAADATSGSWFYSTNSGGAWSALGTPTNAACRLLAADASTRVYFQPNANFNGTVANAITFRAWDQTSGTNGGTADASTNGGATAFSTATDVAAITVNAVNDAPTGTNLSAAETYTEDTPLNLIDIVTADVDNANVTVTLTLSNTAAGSLSTATSGAVTSSYVSGTGVWTASGAIADVNTLLAGVVFTPALNFNASFTIATSVSDGVAAAVTGSKAMTGTAVNDAPTASNLSAAETYTEDTPLNLVDIVTADVDNANLTVTLTLSNTAAGSLSTATSGAVTSTYVSGTGVWTASGAIADVNTLLAGVVFTPALNFNASFTIATSVSDGVAAAVTGSKTMTGTAVNDAPTASNLSAAESYTEDTPLNLIDIVTADVDNANLTVTLTLSNTSAGSLSTGTSGSVTSTFAAGVWTASGAIANVNTLLAGVVFTPALNFSSSFTIATSVSDGIAAAVTGSKAMTGTAVNDAPTASNLSAAETYTEDTPLNLVDIVTADVDNANLTVTLTISNTAAGSLSTATSGAVTSTFSAGVWTASGAIANVNTLLAGVVFTPALNFNASFTIATSVSDGIAAALTGSKAMTGTAVNDAPTASNLSAAESYTEDVSLNLIDIVTADVDNTNLTVTLTLSNTAAGSLSTATSGAVTSTYVGGTGVWTASGAIADVNTLLAGVVFTPALNFNTNFTIATSVSDGVAAAVTGSKVMTGVAVNDAPTASNLSASETYTEDVSLNLIDIVAADLDNTSLTVTLTLSNTAAGSLSTATSGAVTSTYVSGTGVWTASGAIADVNTLLAGVFFTPAANFNASFSIATSVSDGIAAAVTGSKAMTGTAVNDAPVLNAAPSPLLTPEIEESPAPAGAVGTLVSSLVDFATPSGQVDNVTDVDAGALLGIAIISADASFGSWFYSTNNGAVWNALGTPSATTARLLAADASTRLYFQPALNFSGNVLMIFRAWDRTSGSNGGNADASVNGGTTAFSAVSDVATLVVTAVNDAPFLNAAASPGLSAENEDAGAPSGAVGTLVNALVDFNPPAGGNDNVTDVDPSPVTGIAVIAVDATGGSWFYSTDNGGVWNALGTPTGASCRLLAADAGTRVYLQPNPDFNGTLASAITFRAWDQSSGVNGGVADATTNGGATPFSTNSDVAAITVTAINDAPVNNLPGTQNTPQDQTLVLSTGAGNAISISDVDVAAASIQVTLAATNGVISLSGVTGLSFSVGTGTNNTTMTFTGSLNNVNNALNGMSYSPILGFSGSSMITMTTSDQGNTGTGGALSDVDVLTINVTVTNIQVAVRAMLDGPYDATTGLMADGLRSAGVIPTGEPFTLLGYAFVGGGGESTSASVFTATGADAVVDWVVVELRDNSNPSTIIASKSALIQRDGDVVATDGVSPVSFTLSPNTYRVALRHRNHLGAMTLNGVPLSGSPTTVNFTSAATATYGTAALKSISGTFPTQALWAGDATFDHSVKYTGSGNDRDPILVTVGGTTPNNIVSPTYSTKDVNMNAEVKYTGSSNDRDPILVNVGSTTPTNIRQEQLP